MLSLRKYKDQLIFLSDNVIILFSYMLASLLRFEFLIPEGFIYDLKKMMLVVVLIYAVTFFLFRLYSTLWIVAGYYDYMNIVIANIFSSFMVVIGNMTAENRIPYSVIIISSTIILLGTLATRMMFRVYRRLKFEKSGFRKTKVEGMKNVLIIGAGDAAAMLIKEIRYHSELHMNIVGLIDDSDFKQRCRISGFKVLGRTNNIPEIAEHLGVDEIIMAIPSSTKEEKKRILNISHTTGAKLKTLPGMYEMVDKGISINSIRDVDIADLLGRKEIIMNNGEMHEYIDDKVILVTGGGGSIGSELCRQIASMNPKKLIILDIYENNAYDIQNELKKNFPELDLLVLIASVRDKQKINSVFEKQRPQIVFHAAAHKHVPLMETSPDEAIKNNVFGTLNVAMAAKEYKAERFIMISTDKAVNPTNIMGATKRLCEMVIQTIDTETKETDFVAVRFGNVLGSNGSVIPLFKKQIEEGGPVTLTHKDMTRFFMTIPEAVQLVLQAGSFAKGGEIYVLDMGEPVKIYDLAENLIKLSGYEPNKDIEIKIIGLRPGEKLYEELLMAEEGLESTSNKLIFVGRPNKFKKEELQAQLRSLKITVTEDDESMNQIKEIMQGIVTTYVPDMT